MDYLKTSPKKFISGESVDTNYNTSSEETANGNTKMTPIVLALAHSKGRKGKKEPEEMQSEGTEGRRRRGAKPSQTETPTPTPTPVPVDSERCKRSDGRGWQCKSKASPGVGYCEHHYKRVIPFVVFFFLYNFKDVVFGLYRYYISGFIGTV